MGRVGIYLSAYQAQQPLDLLYKPARRSQLVPVGRVSRRELFRLPVVDLPLKLSPLPSRPGLPGVFGVETTVPRAVELTKTGVESFVHGFSSVAAGAGSFGGSSFLGGSMMSAI
jgi:hypothetical protein